MNDFHFTPLPRSNQGASRVSVLLALVLVLLAGIAAGVVWHEPLRALFGHEGGTPAPAKEAGAAKQLWTCGMHPQVIQDRPGDCPICHMELTPLSADMAGGGTQGGERKVAYWWDPMMDPPYISEQPGKSPMGMDLVPVHEDEVSGGAGVTIDPVVVQNMGVRVAEVVEAPLTRTIRVFGHLEEPEPNHVDVNLRVSGWIQTLFADTDGMPVEKGDPLFELYSPELQVAIEELIAVRKSGARGRTATGAAGADSMADALGTAIETKLALLGLDPEDIAEYAKLDRAPATVTFKSPMSGHLTEKRVYAGAAVKAGDLVMRIADRSTMWLEMRVFEQDLAHVRLGQAVRATVESLPGEDLEGEVVFVHPHVDPLTRTALVRAVLPNAELLLRQGMYATGAITLEIAPRAILVPREAVIDTGERQIAFVAQERGHFEPRTVRMGAAGGDGLVQVLSGLAPGERVVTSGQFLLDAESRLREAIQKHLAQGLVEPDAGIEAPVGTPVSKAPPPDAAGEAPRAEVDALFSAYLTMVRTLGAPHPGDTPVDAREVVSAAKTLAEKATGETAALAVAVQDAAAALSAKPVEEQRGELEALSTSMIALAARQPPSRAVAERLYVLYCPMAPGHWLQTHPKVENPYYARAMKACGEVHQTIEPAAGR